MLRVVAASHRPYSIGFCADEKKFKLRLANQLHLP